MGDNYGEILNGYATGNVSGNSDVGGLAGSSNLGTVSNSYATGNISGDEDVGGLTGDVIGFPASNSFYCINYGLL